MLQSSRSRRKYVRQDRGHAVWQIEGGSQSVAYHWACSQGELRQGARAVHVDISLDIEDMVFPHQMKFENLECDVAWRSTIVQFGTASARGQMEKAPGYQHSTAACPKFHCEGDQKANAAHNPLPLSSKLFN